MDDYTVLGNWGEDAVLWREKSKRLLNHSCYSQIHRNRSHSNAVNLPTLDCFVIIPLSALFLLSWMKVKHSGQVFVLVVNCVVGKWPSTMVDFHTHNIFQQEPMSRSMQFLDWIYIEWDSRGSAITNHKTLIDVTASLERNCLSFTKEMVY